MKEMTSDEVKKVEILTLEKLNEICKENNITYWLAYGTLLGCIRHHGFIPWDDDIDVIMPRPDYEQFCNLNVWNNSIESLGVRLVTLKNTSDYWRPYACLNDIRTKVIHKVMKDYNDSGVGIDIFPLDGLGKDINNAKRLIKMLHFERELIQSSLYKNPKYVYKDEKNIVKKIFKYILSHSYWKNKLMLCHMEHNAVSYNYRDSIYVGVVYGTFKEIMDKTIFSNTLEEKFEGKLYPIPYGYDQYLTNLYGDYMVPPPVYNRVSHQDATYYWK